ncbi:MAG TPA: proline dehydrogenase family protein [Anaerolineaceae bacterium]|nr:proline dehydrogenase family protein [Anaerolineaceae bacterium]
MLRTVFISLSKASWAQKAITRQPFAWKAASRFVAGETYADAIRVVRQLNSRGIQASLDYLGENTNNVEAAREAAENVISLLSEIQKSETRSNVSIKLSQLGLSVDEELCRNNLARILKEAVKSNNFIRIDMEDATTTTQTLNVYRWALEQGFENLGVVIQAYLFRSEKDVSDLANCNAKIRLVKGAYKESKDVAYPKKKDVDAQFDRLTEALINNSVKAGKVCASEDGRTPPIVAIASHDEKRIQWAQQTARRYNLPSRSIEFQLLYGIRRDLQEKLVSAGYPVRVYVPYGTHWYAYFMRRLAERPANVWFIFSNYLRN